MSVTVLTHLDHRESGMNGGQERRSGRILGPVMRDLQYVRAEILPAHGSGSFQPADQGILGAEADIAGHKRAHAGEFHLEDQAGIVRLRAGPQGGAGREDEYAAVADPYPVPRPEREERNSPPGNVLREPRPGQFRLPRNESAVPEDDADQVVLKHGGQAAEMGLLGMGNEHRREFLFGQERTKFPDHPAVRPGIREQGGSGRQDRKFRVALADVQKVDARFRRRTEGDARPDQDVPEYEKKYEG